MKTFIYGVVLAALYCCTGLSTPTAPTNANLLDARIVRPCPDICPEPGTVAQPTGFNGACICPSTTASPTMESRVNHPCPEIACPQGTTNLPDGGDGDCGCFPIRPLPTPRSLHCDLVCLPGTEHDPSGPICNCDKTVPTLPEKRNPQGGPICDIVCPTGYENDPADGDCNCAKPICDPSRRCFAIGELYQYNLITQSCQCEYQLECLIACPRGFERDPAISGCNCLKKIPSTSTSGTAATTQSPGNIEERNPEATPVCRFVCPPCTAYDPAIPGCNCALDTCPAITTLSSRNIEERNLEATPVCYIECPPCKAHDPAIPGCNCALDICSATTTLSSSSTEEPSPEVTPVCDFKCPPCYAHDPDIPGCNCALETCVAGP